MDISSRFWGRLKGLLFLVETCFLLFIWVPMAHNISMDNTDAASKDQCKKSSFSTHGQDNSCALSGLALLSFPRMGQIFFSNFRPYFWLPVPEVS